MVTSRILINEEDQLLKTEVDDLKNRSKRIFKIVERKKTSEVNGDEKRLLIDCWRLSGEILRKIQLVIKWARQENHKELVLSV